MNRVPLLTVGVALIAGILTSLLFEIPTSGLLLGVVAASGFGVLLVWRSKNLAFAHIVVLVAFLALGAYRTNQSLARPVRRQMHALAQSTDSARVIGQVKSVSETPRSTIINLERAKLIADHLVLDSEPLSIRVVLRGARVTQVSSGDLVIATGTLSSGTQISPSGELLSMLVNRIACTVLSDTSSTVIAASGNPGALFRSDGVRSWIVRAFDVHLNPDGAALSKALVLGERRDFSSEFSDALRLSGMSHVFALSGVNVGLLVSLIWLGLTALFVPRPARILAALLFIVFYAELGRQAPSLVRASLMCGVYLLGLLLHRRTSWVNVVVAAVIIELCWRPLDLLDPGFQLSYLAVVGLGVGYGAIFAVWSKLPAKRGVLRYLVALALATVVTQIATMPLIGFLFHRIPLFGSIGNLVAIPGFALLLVWSVILLATALLFPPLAPVAGTVLDVLSFVLGQAVSFISSFQLSSLFLGPLPYWSVVVLALASGLTLLGLRPKKLRVALVGVLLALVVLVWSNPARAELRTTSVAFLNVGNGDATLISSGGKRVLVDAGASSTYWNAANVIMRYLVQHGIDRIDALILTHSDSDHIGGAAELMRQVPIGAIFTNGKESINRSSLEVETVACEQRIPLQRLTSGDIIVLSPRCSLAVLWPDTSSTDMFASDNQQSIVLRLVAHDCTALLMGDADSTVETVLTSVRKLHGTGLLKVGHHGSLSSSSSNFLKEVSPEIAVFSVGRTNRYGHPSPAVLHRLCSFDIPWLSTAEQGSLEFLAKPGGWIRTGTQHERLARMFHIPYV